MVLHRCYIYEGNTQCVFVFVAMSSVPLCSEVPRQLLWLRFSLLWRHNERDSVSNRRLYCLHNRLFRRWSKKTLKLRVTCFCEGNSPGTGEFPAQRASNAENVSIWWRHHVIPSHVCLVTAIHLKVGYRKMETKGIWSSNKFQRLDLDVGYRNSSHCNHR